MQSDSSNTKLFLVLVFTDWDPNWREECLLMDEESGVMEVASAAIASFPYRRERHLFFELREPLSARQRAVLEEQKGAGMFKSYFVCQEITDNDGSTVRMVEALPSLKEFWLTR